MLGPRGHGFACIVASIGFPSGDKKMKTILQVAIGVATFSIPAAAIRGQCDCPPPCVPCVPQYRIVCQAVWEEKQFTCNRVEHETVYDTRQVTTYRPVFETHTQEHRFTVCRPVTETSERE